MKKIIIPIVIILIIILIVILNNQFNSTIKVDEVFEEEFSDFSNTEVITEEGSMAITGKGNIESFNIEKLNTDNLTSIDEVYAKDGDMINANQRILKVSNSEATGIISSTISGKLFIEELQDKSNYYIYDLNNIGIEIEVDEKDASKLKIGQFVNVNIHSSPDVIIGKVYYISKVSSDGIIKVKIKIDYSDNIKFGYTAKVEILINDEIDPTVQEYDTKNSLIKMGKTDIKYKNASNNYIPEEPSFEELPDFDIEEPEQEPEQEPDDFEIDTEEISEYYNGYWSEYWNEYWKAYWKKYYEVGKTLPDIKD